MSDANLISPPDIEWNCNGSTLRFGRCDLETELAFQSIHERWALNRLETLKAGVSPDSYESMASRIADQVASNRFAFGGPLSWQFLFTPQGMAEYLSLLSRRAKRREGGPPLPVTPSMLDAYRRADEKGWERLWQAVTRRDFPNQMPQEEAQASGPGENPTASTTESSSPSTAGPGG